METPNIRLPLPENLEGDWQEYYPKSPIKAYKPKEKEIPIKMASFITVTLSRPELEVLRKLCAEHIKNTGQSYIFNLTTEQVKRVNLNLTQSMEEQDVLKQRYT